MSKTQHIQLYNRDGTSQQQRQLEEIKPLYAKIDDRRLKDLLSFLWKISEYIQYYDSNNSKSGHWQSFIGVEKAVLQALIAAKDTAPLHYAYLELQSETRETNDKNAYLPLFDLLCNHCLELKKLYEQTHRVLGKELFLSAQNTRLLESCLRELLTLYDAYPGAVDKAVYVDQLKNVGKAMGLSDPSVPPEGDFSNESPDRLDTIMRNALYDVHQGIQKLFKTVIGHADRLLGESMKRKGDFKPHIGLILTFLRLFESYQKQLNSLNAKHLEYYYKDVLKIDYRREIADKVFAVIQLAKNVSSCKLDKGTGFKATKDSKGNDRLYKATEDFVANKSQVVELKSVYRYPDNLDEKGEAGKIGSSEIRYKSVKAAIKADSGNGKDEALDPDNPQFPPFCDDHVKDYAKLGFALASPVLRVGGGRREVTTTLKLANDLLKESASLKEVFVELPVDLTGMLEIHLTCEKGWEAFSSSKGKAKEFAAKLTTAESGDPQIVIDFTLDSSFPAVVDFDKKVHLDRFAEDHPVCKVVLKQDSEENYYELFARMSLISCTVGVVVSGLKDLVLQNDQGVLKSEKPMMLFGNEPVANSSFYIGSQEVFSKKLDTLSVKWDWVEDYIQQASSLYGNYATVLTDLKGSFPDVKVAFERLLDNEWEPFNNEWPLSQGTEQVFQIDFLDAGEAVESDFVGISGVKNKFKELTSFKNYSLELQDGLIRIVLVHNSFLFGHKKHAEALSTSLKSFSIQTKDGKTTITNPSASIKPPITPMIQNVELSYKSSVASSVTEEDENLQFFHLHPFGTSREKLEAVAQEKSHPLMADLSEEGSFYIGLAGLVPPQNISLLFQFVEGTGDPLVAMPDKVKWSYLTTDRWRDFDGRSVLKDGTRSFSGTGIVSLSIPKDAVEGSTLMPANRHWLRAAVSKRSRAVNKLASVKTQAMQLEFDHRNNAADHYEAALPAQSISKLLESVAKVKSVTQPFASFGGRPRQSRKTYFVRVSERLRHKDRAVTLWDYERLVLENFPQIHKVKCLNHTSLVSDIAPGYVKVVVIPNLANLNAVNMLKPAVNAHLRDEIKGFLEKRCSTFIRLKVVNPRYETLRVIADVTYHKHCDVGYCNAQLSEDIKDFLTPWKSNVEEIHFHETLHSSMILNFIEERKYVDYLSSFSVERTVEGEDTTSVTLDDIVRSRADSLFVSAAKHAINEPNEE